jgi:hypothetical protein
MKSRCVPSRESVQWLWSIVTACLVVVAVATACGSAQQESEGVAGQPEPTTEAAQTEPGMEVAQAEPTKEAALPEMAYAANAIAVTFQGEGCAYHGPLPVTAGQVPLILDVRDQSDRERYKVIGYTLDEGKTIEDLRAWTSVGHSPLWGHYHGMIDEPRGTLQETSLVLFEGPLFLACITDPPNYITHVLGPIEVELPAKK